MQIHVGIAYDQNYLPQFYALAASIFARNRQHEVVIHAIVTGVTESSRADIAKYVGSNGAQIHFYEVDEEQLSKYVLVNKWTPAVYYRLMFPLLVPADVTKLLYIDSDTLVLNDLSKLYDQNTDNFPVAAVYDNYVKKQELLGIMEEGQYFNSGVLLMNIPMWNEQRISEQCFDYLAKYPERIRFVDQCALNAVLKNNWKKMDYRMNCLHSYLPDGMSRNEMRTFIRDVVILHFTLQRPWKMLCSNPYRKLYHYYLASSPYELKEKYVDYSIKKTPHFLKIRAMELYFNMPVVQKLWRSIKR